MKIVTQQCGNIKISMGCDEKTDKVLSLKLDIGILTSTDIKSAIKILEGVLEFGPSDE